MAEQQQKFPLLASRSVDGLHLFDDVHKKNGLSWAPTAAYYHDPIPEKLQHRAMQFSSCGRYFAYVNESTGCHILDTTTKSTIFTIQLPKTSWLQFSSTGDFVCLYQPLYAQKDGSKPPPNVTIWSVSEKSKINEIMHKAAEWTGFLWAPDDAWYARISADQKSVLFFEPDQGAKVQNRISTPDGAPIKAFSVGEGRRVHKKTLQVTFDPLVSIFTPEYKSQPARVRVFRYPDFANNAVLASKSFFKAEDAILYWSNSASSVVVLASTEIDKSGQSYYGSTQLHHLCARGKGSGEAAIVPISKQGPVYDVAWQPNKEAFCVVYGFMPSKATVYRSPQLDVLYDFEDISKNQCLYSPGNTGLLALVGFGNLGGKIEVWKTDEKVKVCEFSSPDTTQFEWAADGVHFVAATTSPRMRVENRIDVLTCVGQQLFRLPSKELWQVCFQPNPEMSDRKLALSETQIKTAQKETKQRATEEKARKFIPPGLRRQKEAERAARSSSNNQASASGDGASKKTLENKAKAIKKKITSIRQLKVDQEKGKTLNSDQISKIKNEANFQKDLEEILAKIASM